MSFSERLQLVVDATTAGGEAGFARLTGSARGAQRAATDTGESVARAAQRAADARLKEADAAGRVRVAEQRLEDLRNSGRATSAQLVAAEERLATAQRQHHTASREVADASQAQSAAVQQAAASTDDLAQASEDAGGGLDDLKGKIAGFLAGVSLADWAHGAVTGFIDGARASSAMATSMNATVEQAGAFLGLVGSVGLELDDLIEIQAEFATKTQDGMTQVGTELQHNADGTINWTETLVDALATLQEIPDATERNRLGFSMFGEEGYKQLSRLLNSGTDVRDALEQVGTPFTDADVELAREFDAAMLQIDSQSGELGRTLGRAVLPVITGLLDAGQDLANVITAIPGPIAATGAAAILLGIGMRRASTEGTILAGVLARASAAAASFRYMAALTSVSAATMGAALGGAAAAGRGLVGILGGPLGVGLIAAGGAYYLVSEGVDAFRESAKQATTELGDLDEGTNRYRQRTEELGRQLADEAGFWEGLAASRRGAANAIDEQGGALEAGDTALGGLLTTVTSLADQFSGGELAAEGFTDEIDAQREALGAYGQQQEVVQQTTKSLNDLIAEGTTGGSEFAGAVRDAAEAEADQARTTGIAEAAIDAYNATTRDAIQTILELYQAQLGQRSGWQDVLTALQDAATATEDTETAASEVEQAYIDAASAVLDYAGSAADAAVEAARAAGTVLDPLTEAQIRADATIEALKRSLDAPNLTERAQREIQAMIDRLGEAQESGNIEAILSLTGTEEVDGELNRTTEDRETTVSVESRGGPAVDRYLDGLAEARRLAIVRVESRGGPAVRAYLDGLAEARRLAIIRVETRGGPAVDAYLDSLTTQDRLAIIRVETRGGPAVQQYLDDLAGAARVAAIAVQGAGLRGGPGSGALAGGSLVQLGSVTLDLELTGRASRDQLSKAERGRATVENIRAYEQRNGTGWRRNP